MKIDFDCDSYGDGHAVQGRRLESPGSDRLNRFFVKAIPDGFDYTNVVGGAIRFNDEAQ